MTITIPCTQESFILKIFRFLIAYFLPFYYYWFYFLAFLQSLNIFSVINTQRYLMP